MVQEYCNIRHQQQLPSGARAGFLLGDGNSSSARPPDRCRSSHLSHAPVFRYASRKGAGMGKGRQIAGLIFNNIRGNKTDKHIRLSASADLADDARRDFDDIGGGS